MKSGKQRKSIRQIDYPYDIVATARDKNLQTHRGSELDTARNNSASKSYRITTNEQLKVPNSPSTSNKAKTPMGLWGGRKFSGNSEMLKTNSRIELL